MRIDGVYAGGGNVSEAPCIDIAGFLYRITRTGDAIQLRFRLIFAYAILAIKVIIAAAAKKPTQNTWIDGV